MLWSSRRWPDPVLLEVDLTLFSLPSVLPGQHDLAYSTKFACSLFHHSRVSLFSLPTVLPGQHDPAYYTKFACSLFHHSSADPGGADENYK